MACEPRYSERTAAIVITHPCARVIVKCVYDTDCIKRDPDEARCERERERERERENEKGSVRDK